MERKKYQAVIGGIRRLYSHKIEKPPHGRPFWVRQKCDWLTQGGGKKGGGQTDLVYSGMVWQGWVCLGLVWSGVVWCGLVWYKTQQVVGMFLKQLLYIILCENNCQTSPTPNCQSQGPDIFKQYLSSPVCHVSHVLCYVSCVICHMSRFRYHKSLFYNFQTI